MKSVIKYLLIIYLVLISSAVSAKELEDEINVIEQAYSGASDISVKFTQKTFIKLIEKDVIKRGQMFFKRGGRFKIVYDGKNEKSYVSDGKLLWVFIKGDDSSLVIYKVNDETVPREAMTFLNNFDTLRKDFRIKASDAFPDLKEGQAALYLIPKSKKAHFNALDAKFNTDHILEELIIHNKSGNLTRYTFSDIKISTGLGDSLFDYGAGKAIQ